MFVKREDTIKAASSLVSRALLLNTVIVLVPPLYIFFSESIGLHTYLALAFLALSLASLTLVYQVRRAIEDYSLTSARKLAKAALPLGFLGGAIIVGLLLIKALKILSLVE